MNRFFNFMQVEKEPSMRLLLNIKNEQILDKLLWVLKHFESDGVEIIQGDVIKENNITYSDEYIEKNWKEMVSKALADFDADSDDWKYEYGEYLAEKYK